MMNLSRWDSRLIYFKDGKGFTQGHYMCIVFCIYIYNIEIGGRKKERGKWKRTMR
jgi:hypothetical protein